MATEPKEYLVITAVGPDRVGLVEKITQFLLEVGCNIEDSKMAAFCGEFAIILLVSGEASGLDKVSSSLDVLKERTGLDFHSKRTSPKSVADSALPCRLQASCLDHPGVVHKFSAALSRRGINIESLETTTQAAPMSGTPIFQLEARLSLPRHINLHDLRKELEEIGMRENIDIEFSVLTKR